MLYEVEMKFPVHDLEEVKKSLLALGCEPCATVSQADTYFAHPARDFAKTDEALRIRRIVHHEGTSESRITYKGPKLDQTTKTRQEIELPLVSEGSGKPNFRELLAALGFVPVAEVEKTRTTMMLHQNRWEIEVALDTVQGLGTFLEIEVSAEESNLDAARKIVLDLASELELGNSERRSYLELLLQQK